MTQASPRRRPRGSLTNSTQAKFLFEQATVTRVTEMTRAANATRSALVQWLLDTVELDEHGAPVGWFDAHPELRPNPSGQLPMTA
jgi:hypothetical protein